MRHDGSDDAAHPGPDDTGSDTTASPAVDAVRAEPTSRRGAFSGGLWTAAATVVPMVSTLALSIVISRELGADVLGQQSLVAYVASTMVSVLIYSFTTASVQLLASAVGARNEARLAWLGRWSFAAHLGGGAVTAGVLVSIGLARNEYTSLWLLAAATALVDSTGWAYASRDIARRGWTPTSRRRLVAQMIGPLASIAAIYAGWGIQGVFAAQLVVAGVLLIVLSRLDRDAYRPSTRDHEAPPWRPVLQLWGLFAVSTLITQIVERRLELVFLDAFQDARTVAMYSVAFNLVSIPTLLSGSLIHSTLPAIASRYAQDPDSVVPALSRAARVIVTIDLVLAAGTVTVGPGLILTAYGSDFGEGANLVRFLGLTLLIVPLGQLCSALWSGTGRLRPVLLAGGVGAVLDVGLAWTLIPALSTTGAVIATTTAQTASAIIMITYTVRSGVHFDLRPRRLALAASIAVLAGAAAAVLRTVVDGLPGDLAAGVAFIAVIAVGSRLVGLFSHQDVDWLAETVPGPAGRLVRAFSPPASSSA